MDVSSFMGGNFLTHVDLPIAIQTWTIAKVDQQMVGQGAQAEEKICVTFSEFRSKPLSMNKTNLKRIVRIYTTDATEWIGPYHDHLMGFYKAAQYYYYPGWHEPGTAIELIVNKSAFEQLPRDLQQILRAATARSNTWTLSEFEAKNNLYLQKLTEEHNVQLRKFPDAVLNALQKFSHEVVDELVASDAMSKKVYESFNAFRKNATQWAQLSEKMYYSSISG